MNDRIVVAVDGPAGSGKSTVSRTVARQAGLKYIDSGALYRSITWLVLESSVDPAEAGDDTVIGLMNGALIEQSFLPDGKCRTFVNGRDVTDLIRNERIAGNIGRISDRVAVRERVNELLRAWASRESVIMDGRDIGTVVFPHADVKFYLDASVDVRSVRRVKEYLDGGKNVDEFAIKKQIMLRDSEDMNRPYGALARAEDAIFIDTSDMDIEDVVDVMIAAIREKSTGNIQRHI